MTEPLGIYVHIPFCSAKCPYCDFNSYAGQSRLIPAYVEAVCRELDLYSPSVEGLRLESVYFGGGAPSLIAPGQAGRILDRIRRMFGTRGEEPEVEISLEANPEGLASERLEGYRRAGVSRLSIGAQSFSDRVLGLLGRRHCAASATKAFLAAREAGYENVNLDLIYGIPGQTLEEWRETIEVAIGLGPEHVSCYALTLEEGRGLPGGVREIPEEVEDAAAEMLALARGEFSRSDYRHYEISNFCRPGRECRHNLLYWRNLCWLGVGAGAHSHLAGERWENLAHPQTYVDSLTREKNPVRLRHRPSPEERRGDRAFLGLRLLDGLDLGRFEAEEGASLTDVYPGEVAELLEAGLLALEDGRLRLTPKGIPLANEVFCRFV